MKVNLTSTLCNPPVAFIGAINVYISGTYKVRVRTHKNCLVDWFYKIKYGWKDVPYLPEGTDMVHIPGYGIIVRDETVLEQVKAVCETLDK